MDIFEQYFSKQLDYTYYKYVDKKWYNKGIDSLVINKKTDPYYVYELLEVEVDDFLYFPILNKSKKSHRFLTSEADYIFYFKQYDISCKGISIFLTFFPPKILLIGYP